MATFTLIIALAFFVWINPITQLALNEHRDWGNRYLGEELQEVAERRTKELNKAYQQLKKER